MKTRLFVITTLVVMIVAGCGNNGASKPSGQESAAPTARNPITLTIANDGSSLNDTSSFDKVKEAVKQKYPYLTLNFIDANGTKLDALLTAGTLPDIISTYTSRIPLYLNKNLLQDQTALLKSSGLDLSRFDDVYLAPIRALSDKGELYGIPFFVTFWGLYYNQDLFDKFGVSYPKDGMTWGDMAELAKRLNRTEGGTRYWGADLPNWPWAAQQMGLDIVDARTNKVNLTSDNWVKSLQILDKVWQAVGLKPDEKIGDFYKDGTVAMKVDSNVLVGKMLNVPFNWNIAQPPSVEGIPNVAPNTSPHVLMVTKSSKYQDDAMKVIQVIVSDDMQTWFAENQAKMSVLKNPAIIAHFAQSFPQLTQKHLASVFKSKPAAAGPASKYMVPAQSIVNKAMSNYQHGVGDLNSTLRQAQSDVEKMIQEDQSK